MSALAILPAEPGADPRPRVDIRRTTMPILTQIPSRRRTDEIQFAVVYHATLPVFLVTSVVRRCLSGRRPAGFAGETLSIVREAKASAQTCGSFSLMG